MLRRLSTDGPYNISLTHTHTHLPLGSDSHAIPVMLLLRYMIYFCAECWCNGTGVTVECVSVPVFPCESLFQNEGGHFGCSSRLQGNILALGPGFRVVRLKVGLGLGLILGMHC